MKELLTAAQMQKIERAAMASGVVSGLTLMERAGRGVIEAAFKAWPEMALSSYSATVLCGPGNNGGDGFVIARLLREQGWDVSVFIFGVPEKLPPDARRNFERVGVDVQALDLASPPDMTDATLVVDALFGTGIARALEGFGAVFSRLEALKNRTDGPKIVAVDIPSGICADSGREFPTKTKDGPFSAVADLTVSFHSAKIGHVLAEGAVRSGPVVVKDIGLEAGGATSKLIEAPEAQVLEKTSGHKFGYGHALILVGGVAHGGAARLAARGALRIGAGLVTLGCPPAAIIENASQVNAVMLKRVAGPDGVSEVLEDARMNAVCVGPGLGCRAETQALVKAVLMARRATVVDADGLSAFETNPKDLFEHLHADCVLTPHAGEFARLFPDIAARLRAPATDGPAFSKQDATREAAARAGCTVLFKGADTVIASESGTAAIHAAFYDRAAPWLATAGSGDVLAGFITGLLARGFTPLRAASIGVWLHVECARSFGAGLIAEDLPEELPAVFKRLV